MGASQFLSIRALMTSPRQTIAAPRKATTFPTTNAVPAAATAAPTYIGCCANW